MSPKTRFRQFLLSSVAVGFAYLPASIIGERNLPHELIAFNDARAQNDITIVEMAAMVLTLALAIAAIINVVALYRFRPVARPWAIAITVALLPVYLSFGPWIESGIEESVSNAATILWGIVLALMYCQPYAALFVVEAPSS